MEGQQQRSEEYRELVDDLDRTPEIIRRAVGGIDAEHYRRRSTSGDWSFVEQVCHLRDIEVEGYQVRIARLLNESNPHLLDIDGDRLAAERDYLNQNLDAALADFTHARKMNVQSVRDLAGEQLSRQGQFGNDGQITLLELLEKMRQHDREHIDQLTHLVEQLSQ